MRSLENIIEQMKDVAQMRQSQNRSRDSESLGDEEECQCGSDLLPRVSDPEFEEHEDQEKQDGEDPFLFSIYIKKSAAGSLFSVCPKCDPKKQCLLCGGTGHKTYTQNQAEVFELESCPCMGVHKITKKLNAARIPEKYVEATFLNFKLSHLKDIQQKKLMNNIHSANLFCTQFIEHLNSGSYSKKNGKYFLVLYGPVGTGKTHLAVAFLKKLMMSSALSGYFLDFQYLLSQLRERYDSQSSGEDILRRIKKCDVLIIDEFGKGRMDREWPLEKLDDLVNYRYNEQKLTLLTTNYLVREQYKGGENLYAYQDQSFSNDVPPHESFWVQSLEHRIGRRMFERLLEIGLFLDFTGIASYRRLMGQHALKKVSFQ